MHDRNDRVLQNFSFSFTYHLLTFLFYSASKTLFMLVFCAPRESQPSFVGLHLLLKRPHSL